jgi:hypothetical protein
LVLKRVLVAFLCVLFICGCAVQEKRSDRIASQHPEGGPDTIGKLASKNIEVGMTRQMVQASLGTADSVSREGEEEVWGYAVWIVKIGDETYQEYVYFVRFKGDKVVGTRGDVTPRNKICIEGDAWLLGRTQCEPECRWRAFHRSHIGKYRIEPSGQVPVFLVRPCYAS